MRMHETPTIHDHAHAVVLRFARGWTEWIVCAGALLHAAEAAHNSEPPQHVLQHAQQGPPALGPPPAAAPLDVMGCLQQLLQGQQVMPLFQLGFQGGQVYLVASPQQC